jgi:cytidylate kinase
MGATTITLSVQLGSGGFNIARSVADKLGFRYYDWEVTSQAADEAGVSPDVVASAERVPSLAERIMERFFNAGFYAGDIPEAVVPTSTTMDTALQTLNSANYREMIAAVVRNLADRGSSVIVGHAGQVVLHNRPGVLKVLVHGSLQHRVNRLAVDEGMTIEQATEAVKRNDADRQTFFKHYYKINWLDATHYDLTINTDTLSDEQATSILLGAAQGISPVQTPVT